MRDFFREPMAGIEPATPSFMVLAPPSCYTRRPDCIFGHMGRPCQSFERLGATVSAHRPLTVIRDSPKSCLLSGQFTYHGRALPSELHRLIHRHFFDGITQNITKLSIIEVHRSLRNIVARKPVINLTGRKLEDSVLCTIAVHQRLENRKIFA